ncbi:hypothetical protein GCM10009100_03700 [Thalassospira tepidiphila]
MEVWLVITGFYRVAAHFGWVGRRSRLRGVGGPSNFIECAVFWVWNDAFWAWECFT